MIISYCLFNFCNKPNNGNFMTILSVTPHMVVKFTNKLHFRIAKATSVKQYIHLFEVTASIQLFCVDFLTKQLIFWISSRKVVTHSAVSFICDAIYWSIVCWINWIQRTETEKDVPEGQKWKHLFSGFGRTSALHKWQSAFLQPKQTKWLTPVIFTDVDLPQELQILS